MAFGYIIQIYDKEYELVSDFMYNDVVFLSQESLVGYIYQHQELQKLYEEDSVEKILIKKIEVLEWKPMYLLTLI